MKVISLIFLLSVIIVSTSGTGYRGNAQQDYQQLVNTLNELFSVGTTFFNQVMQTSYRMERSVNVQMGELMKAFEEASFQNGNLVGVLMQKSNQDNFSQMLKRIYLPAPLPTMNYIPNNNYNLDLHFNNSIRANRDLNAIVMKMWMHLKSSNSKADKFLKNIDTTFREMMDARPEMVHAIAKISGRKMPCYKSHNQFLPRHQYMNELYKEIDLYIELLNILDEKNRGNYNQMELEYLKMVTRKFVLSASNFISVMLELFRHSKEFYANLRAKSDANNFEIKEQLILEHPIDFATVTNILNNAQMKNKYIINLSLKLMIRKHQEMAYGLNNWPYDRDFESTIDANQQLNAMLIYEWKRFRNGTNLPLETLKPISLRYSKGSEDALQELGKILRVLDQMVDVKVKLITILLQIWTRGRYKQATPIDYNLESHYLKKVTSPSAMFENSLQSNALQNSPSFTALLGNSDISSILGGFLFDSGGLFGLDLGAGGLGVGGSGLDLSSILGSNIIEPEMKSMLSKAQNAQSQKSKNKNPLMPSPTISPTIRPSYFTTTASPIRTFPTVTTRKIIPTAAPQKANQLIDSIVFPDSALLQNVQKNQIKAPISNNAFNNQQQKLHQNKNPITNNNFNNGIRPTSVAPPKLIKEKDSFIFPDSPKLNRPNRYVESQVATVPNHQHQFNHHYHFYVSHASSHSFSYNFYPGVYHG